MATTTRLSLRYPVASDTADVPRDIGNLASDLDKAAIFGKGVFASRPTSTVGSPGIDGRYYFATDTSRLYLDTGTSWVEVASGTDSVTSAMIAADAVGSSEIATDAVGASEIAAGAVGISELAQTAKGLVFIAGSSPSAASTVSFDNVFTSTFTTYRVVASLKVGTGGPQLRVRLRASSSDDTSTNYCYTMPYSQLNLDTVWGGKTRSTGDTSFHICDVYENRSVFAFDLTAPKLSEYTGIAGVAQTGSSDGLGILTVYGGHFKSTTAFDGLTLYPGSSSLTGYVAVYGYTE